MERDKSLVFRGNVVDIIQRKTYGAEIMIADGKIESITPTGKDEGRFFIPGLIDSHVHIESSMATPNAFAHAALKHGTVGVVADPHEIANVLGVRGIDYIIDNAKETPCYYWFGAPSCVPASPFVTSGGTIEAAAAQTLVERNSRHF